jgi:hypothetical protein
MAWRYIRMTCDTLNKEHEESYLQFVQHIQPVFLQGIDEPAVKPGPRCVDDIGARKSAIHQQVFFLFFPGIAPGFRHQVDIGIALADDRK